MNTCILYIVATERLVVCFIVYGLNSSICNGCDAAVPARRNVNLPKGFGQESSGPASQRHTAEGPDQVRPSASRPSEGEAINLKPQERKAMQPSCVFQRLPHSATT